MTLSTSTAAGDDSPAIEAYAAGGSGGWGGWDYNSTSTSNGGTGGNGGNVSGNVTVTLAAANSISLTADGAKSPGIAAVSAGGAGGLAYGAHYLVLQRFIWR